ncbi:ComEC/Rec2 family competence protein [Paracidobacterium acidisoli]|uniref:Metallo-beta-lactamase domain-containing protein n=1 Tax=Paracidobacterium acidisoli TaxID=2303751 RepID=A0A372IJ41_9BACT|nr:MBL fold metallo-hydrolase [Paracidobacterium acidisoli]MBT9333127.1 hypothetical protein [Paracidobacterium acidisoli]
MNRRNFVQGLALAVGAAPSVNYASAPAAEEVVQSGSPAQAWTPGTLDIHHISTGCGAAAFILCPDGTTMMVDTGAIIPQLDPSRSRYLIPAKPNASLRPGQWVARYVLRELQAAGRREIDYFVLTHFHADHMGEIAEHDLNSSPMSKYGKYQLGGLTDLAEEVPIRTIIDRNFPRYDYPQRLDSFMDRNYRAFLESFRQRGGTVERFEPGRADQILLQHDAARYNSFHIRNLASNGAVWTGSGTAVKEQFPSLAGLPQESFPDENKCSLALRLAYGAFRYYTGGDLDHDTYYGTRPWADIETAVAKACGPVDVAVANHHGYVDACGPAWVRALSAKLYIINAWDSAHPAMPGLHNMLSTQLYGTGRAVLSTAMKPENAIAIRRIAEMASTNGHIHIRVPAPGNTFSVNILDNTTETRSVIRSLGPYVCGEKPA